MIAQETFIVRIRDEVNYRLHRLQNIKPMPTKWEQDQFIDPLKKIRGREFRIVALDGSDPISLLTFVHSHRDKFTAMNLTDGIGDFLLSYILKDTAKEVYVNNTSS